jgi:hypothetical protein
MKHVEVEFTNAARAITQQKAIQLELPDQASYRDIVIEVAERYPALIGVLIGPDRQTLLSANLFSRIGEQPVMPEQMDDQPQDGERLVILYFIVGG